MTGQVLGSHRLDALQKWSISRHRSQAGFTFTKQAVLGSNSGPVWRHIIDNNGPALLLNDPPLLESSRLQMVPPPALISSCLKCTHCGAIYESLTQAKRHHRTKSDGRCDLHVGKKCVNDEVDAVRLENKKLRLDQRWLLLLLGIHHSCIALILFHPLNRSISRGK